MDLVALSGHALHTVMGIEAPLPVGHVKESETAVGTKRGEEGQHVEGSGKNKVRTSALEDFSKRNDTTTIT